jgi:hypothetical protein
MPRQVWMSCYIEIGDYVFRHANAIKIKSTWKALSDVCTVNLPNLRGLIDAQKIEKVIKEGDSVLVKFGYDDDLYTEFEGYVASISPKSPFEILCEDEMWKLKQKTVSYSWKTISLKEALQIPGVELEVPDINLSPFRINQLTIAQALQLLKDQCNIIVYFRGKKLFAGLMYTEKGLGEVNYHFQKNAIMGNLVYKHKDGVKIKVHAVSVQKDNKRIEVDFGDDNGEQHTLHYFNKSKEELTALAKEKIKSLKYDGYRGVFTAKGIPRPKHGMVSNMDDGKYPERRGSFFIDGVETDYNGTDGIKREIELGLKADSLLIR